MGALIIWVNVDGQHLILAKLSDELTLTVTSSEVLLRVVLITICCVHFIDASLRSALNDCIEVVLEIAGG
jgi:hypothetical protein